MLLHNGLKFVYGVWTFFFTADLEFMYYYLIFSDCILALPNSVTGINTNRSATTVVMMLLTTVDHILEFSKLYRS